MKIACPLRDQRTQRGSDGRPPEDGNMDCVPESLASMLDALTGKGLVGDDLHDAIYSEGYIGMQDPARYADYLNGLGVSMKSIMGDAGYQISTVVDNINAGHPCLLSIPSDWGDEPPTSQYAHMVAACDVSNGSITCMNPWGGFYQTQPISWWQERLAHCSYRIEWVLAKIGSNSPMSGVPTGWHDNGTVLIASNEQQIGGAFRWYILNHPWDARNVPSGAMVGDGHGGNVQDFTTLRLHWVPGPGPQGDGTNVTQMPIPAPNPGIDVAQLKILMANAENAVNALNAFVGKI